MIAVQLLNDEAALNSFSVIEAKEYVPGDDIKINFQILDPQSGNRLMADGAATMQVVFELSDGTELTKDATFLFDAEDKSMWQVELTATDTMNIVGGNFKVVLDFLGDTTDIRMGMAYNVLSKITFDGEC